MKKQVNIDKEEFKAKVSGGLSEKQLMHYYNCGRTTITAFKKKCGVYSPPRNSVRDGHKKCGICDEVLPVTRFYSSGYSSSGKKSYKPYCSICENNRVNEVYVAKIEKALKNLGKKYACEICGYNKNYTVIEFHHTNGIKKKEISDMKTASLEALEKELRKCKVLCANCHREMHNPTRLL